MTQRKLSVGSTVKIPHLAASVRSESITFRIEQLVTLEGGGLLYKIKSECEPFDRIVGEHELIAQAAGPAKKCVFPS